MQFHPGKSKGAKGGRPPPLFLRSPARAPPSRIWWAPRLGLPPVSPGLFALGLPQLLMSSLPVSWENLASATFAPKWFQFLKKKILRWFLPNNIYCAFYHACHYIDHRTFAWMKFIWSFVAWHSLILLNCVYSIGNCESLSESVIVHSMVTHYIDHHCNSIFDTCVQTRLCARIVFIMCRTNPCYALHCGDSE